MLHAEVYLRPPLLGRNNWHVRFVPPSVDGVPREIFRSTGTKEIPAAKRIAAKILDHWTVTWRTFAESFKLLESPPEMRAAK